MRKLIITLGCIYGLMIFGLPLTAQDRNMSDEQKIEAKKKIEAQKVAFITTQLDMTSDEAQKFWPVFNEFQDKMEAIRRDAKESFSKDEDPNKQLDQFFEMEQSILDLKKAYSQKVKATIGAEKTIKLLQLEKRFARNVLEKYKDRMKESRHGGHRNGK